LSIISGRPRSGTPCLAGVGWAQKLWPRYSPFEQSSFNDSEVRRRFKLSSRYRTEHGGISAVLIGGNNPAATGIRLTYRRNPHDERTPATRRNAPQAMPGSICRTPIKRRTTLSARMWRSRNSTPLALSSSLDRMIASIGPTNRKQSGRSSAAGDMAVTLIGYRRRLFYLKISSVELSEFRPTRNRTHRRNFHRGCEEHPSTDSHDSSSG